MEDTLCDVKNYVICFVHVCLNPCFNGRYSQSDKPVRGYVGQDES